MKSSDEKNEMREMRDAAESQPNDAQKNHSPAPLSTNGNEPDQERDRITRPVHIDREQAEKNIPSDSDPDDPASP